MQVDNSEFIGIVLKDSTPIILIPEIRKGALLYTREHQIHKINQKFVVVSRVCLLYTSPSPRDVEESRMTSSA